jgi:hypothetical protein
MFINGTHTYYCTAIPHSKTVGEQASLCLVGEQRHLACSHARLFAHVVVTLSSLPSRLPFSVKSIRLQFLKSGRLQRGTIFSGTLSELQNSNYDVIKNGIFNSIEAFDNFIIKFQNNVFRTYILQNTVFVFVPVHIKILNNQQTVGYLFNVLETCQYKIKLLSFSGCCILNVVGLGWHAE